MKSLLLGAAVIIGGYISCFLLGLGVQFFIKDATFSFLLTPFIGLITLLGVAMFGLFSFLIGEGILHPERWEVDDGNHFSL